MTDPTDSFHMPIRVLRELCAEKDPASLPAEIKAALEKADMVDREHGHNNIGMTTKDPANQITATIEGDSSPTPPEGPATTPKGVASQDGSHLIVTPMCRTNPNRAEATGDLTKSATGSGHNTPLKVSQMAAGRPLQQNAAVGQKSSQKGRMADTPTSLSPLKILQRGMPPLRESGTKRRDAEPSAAGVRLGATKETEGTETAQGSASSTKNKPRQLSNLSHCSSRLDLGLNTPQSEMGLSQRKQVKEMGSTGQTLNEFKNRVRAKRKTGPQPSKGSDKAGPSKKHIGQDPKADISFNDDGLYTVQVQYEHCIQIARIAGINPSAVLQTIESDNQERRVSLTEQGGASAATLSLKQQHEVLEQEGQKGNQTQIQIVAPTIEETMEQWEARFDPDTDDERFLQGTC